jgi:hypothetical protein
MKQDELASVVQSLIAEHVRSPSLRHIRDSYALGKLAAAIVAALDRRRGLWQKWDERREALVKAAAPCWVPLDRLTDYLNLMAGARLTSTDVAQRMRAVHEEPYTSYPNEELREGCLALFRKEEEAGTELVAIVGALQEFVETEEERLRVERENLWRQRVEEERIALEQRFMSGADCKWTPVGGSKELYCRLNGRTYRLSPTPEKIWDLRRVATPSDEAGISIGRYGRRGDATRALREIAYAPEASR